MAKTQDAGVTLLETGQANKEDAINAGFNVFNALAKGYVYGLRLSWLSGTGIRVGPGVAAVRSTIADASETGELLTLSANKDKTSLSLSNNTTYHIYLYNNSGTVDVEVVTAAPANYFGSAYQKTSDATRRYLGSVRSGATGNLFKFVHFQNTIQYLEDVSASPFRALSAGTATSETNVDLSAVVPATAQSVIVSAINTTGVDMYVGTPDDASSTGLSAVQAGTRDELEFITDSSQRLTYKMASAPGGGGGYIDVKAYRFER